MAMTPTPVLVQTPTIGRANLTSPTALTTRTSIAGTTGLTQLTPVSTNGKRLDAIRIMSKGTSLAGLLSVWLYDGTTSTLWDEIAISAITPSTTAVAFKAEALYSTYGVVLPPAHQLFVSVTVQQDLAVTAHGGDY